MKFLKRSGYVSHRRTKFIGRSCLSTDTRKMIRGKIRNVRYDTQEKVDVAVNALSMMFYAESGTKSTLNMSRKWCRKLVQKKDGIRITPKILANSRVGDCIDAAFKSRNEWIMRDSTYRTYRRYYLFYLFCLFVCCLILFFFVFFVFFCVFLDFLKKLESMVKMLIKIQKYQ